MKPQELTVSCHYSESDADILQILLSSFDIFLKKELHDVAKYRDVIV